MAKQLIAFLDDDEEMIVPVYRRALELAGFDTEHFFRTDELVKFVASGRKVSMFVVDLCMEIGGALPKTYTAGGIFNGLAVAQFLVEGDPSTPVIVLTNVGRRIDLPPPLQGKVEVLRKLDYQPRKFVAMVRERCR